MGGGPLAKQGISRRERIVMQIVSAVIHADNFDFGHTPDELDMAFDVTESIIARLEGRAPVLPWRMDRRTDKPDIPQPQGGTGR